MIRIAPLPLALAGLLAALLAAEGAAATFQGRNVDGKRYQASVLNNDYGLIDAVEVRFQGEHAFVYLHGGGRLVLVLQDEEIVDPAPHPCRRSPARHRLGDQREGPARALSPGHGADEERRAWRPGAPPIRRERSNGGGYFSSFSISSMMPFISRIAASNGADVVMSTPASFSSSMGAFDEPAESIRR